MARQKRVLFRDDPPRAWFLVGITSLRSMPAHIMTGQLRHLLEVSAFPNITIQVVPECWHGGLPGGFIVADRAAYVESLFAGQVYADRGNGFVPGRLLRYDSRGNDASIVD